MTGNAFNRLGRITGVQFRKAKWMWQSVAGSEADAIQAEHGVGREQKVVSALALASPGRGALAS
jgi:hypothetical protein